VGVGDAARTTFLGLWRTVVRVLSVLGAVALIGLIGALLALPLWAFSAYQPRAFTIFALILLASGLVFLIVRRIAGRSREAGSLSGWLRGSVLPALRKTLVTVGFLAAAYVVVVLLVRGSILPGIAVAAAAALFGGYLRFARGRRERSG
jgi:hypothetical protein